MFRKMRRFNQQVSEVTCKEILKTEKRGAFSVAGENDYPYTIPVNFYYDEEEHCIYLHGASQGHKIDAIRHNPKVCFTTWNQGFKKEGNWEWNATSVVVFGHVEFIDDRAIIHKQLWNLASKYYPTIEEVQAEMQSPAASHVQMLRIVIDHMTGKLVNEK